MSIFPRRHAGVLHSVPLFGALAVVEAFQSAHEVSGDTAYALKAYALTYCLISVVHPVTSCSQNRVSGGTCARFSSFLWLAQGVSPF